MRVVFLGTPSFAAIVLQELIGKQDIVGVVTQPDAVRGRGTSKMPSEVKALAEDAGLKVLTPAKLRDERFLAELASLEPEIFCIASYGKIIPNEMLEIPPFGSLNVHASLLPRWRGAAPIERAILEGDKSVGVSIMRVGEHLDMGDYCLQASVEIGDKTAGDLRNELAHIGGKLLLDAITDIQDGTIDWTAQAEEEATYAQKIDRNELFLHPADSADWLVRKVRASARNHPAKLRIADKGVMLEDVRRVDVPSDANNLPKLRAGEALFLDRRLYLGTDDGLVEVERLRPDGKGSMDAASFMSGVQGSKGKVLRWGSYEPGR